MASLSTVNQRAPLGFLDLPGEVRNEIYRHALRRSVLQADHPWARYLAFKKRPAKPKWPFLGLLLTCKGIHREASGILYQYGHLQIYAPACNFTIECINFPIDIGKRYERHLSSVKNVQVHIGWMICRRFRRLFWPPSSIRILCNALVKLPCLKTIRIIWLCHDQGRRLWLKHARPGDELYTELINPFAWLQEQLPGLTVEIETGQSLEE